MWQHTIIEETFWMNIQAEYDMLPSYKQLALDISR